MEQNKRNKKGSDNRSAACKEQQIIVIAALCFAVVSWRATAAGMRAYVFDSAVEAGLISFGIQSILFVFNLRLPYFIERIGTLSPARQQTRSGKHCTGMWRQITAAAFYLIILVSSSFFSFVYICNTVVYEHDTGYTDDNTILLNEFQTQLRQAERVIDENMNYLPLTASRQLADLQAEMEAAGLLADEGKSLEELEEELLAAEEEKKTREEEKAKCQREYNQAWEDYEVASRSRYSRPDEYEDAAENLGDMSEALDTASKKYTDAETAYNTALAARDNYTPSVKTRITSILSNFLHNEVDPETVRTNVNELTDYIMSLKEENSVPDNYAQLVEKIQVLNSTVSNYIKLCGISAGEGSEQEESAKELCERLEQEVVSVETAIPDPQNEKEFQTVRDAWVQTWKGRYQELQTLIWMIPSYSESELRTMENTAAEAVDSELLASHDPLQISDEINDLVRVKLTDINVIERACLLLTGRYWITALVSCLIAFGLDLSSLLAGAVVYWMKKSEQNKLERE